MAKWLEEIPELQGLRDALAFVELARDAKRVGKVVDKLGAAHAAAQDAIAENNRQYEAALKVLREAEAEQERLNQRRRDIEAREGSIRGKEERVAAEASKARQEVAAEKDRMAKREQALVEREKALAAREREAKALESKLAKREADMVSREQAVSAREKRIAEASRLMGG